MSNDLPIHQTIDVTDQACPLSFVKAKLALEDIEIGQRLAVIIRGGEAKRNVPRSFEAEGQRIVELRPLSATETQWRLVVERVT